jgi:adenosine deaminase
LATQKLLHSEENLTRLTFEVIEDAANEGIRILELRFAPTYIQLNHEHLTFERIHGAIAKGVERAKDLPIAVGLIVIIQRISPLEIAARVADFAIACSGKKPGEIVALDLADSEAGFQPRPFAPLFTRAKKAGLHITVHSGEANVPEAAGYVREAIELLGAERIGHGVQIYKDPMLMKFVAEKRIPLELCPTSNWLTSAVRSTAAHPFRFLMKQGLLVTLNSDDPGVFDIDLTNEYEVLAREHGFTAVEFERINDIAAAASFVPLEIKQKYWPRRIDCTLAPHSN